MKKEHLILLGIVAVAAYMFYTGGIPGLPGGGGGSDVVQMECADADGNVVPCGESMFSVVGGTEGVYYIRFTVNAQNTGEIQFDNMTIKSASDSGTDKSGTLYTALKNKQTAPVMKSAVAPTTTASWKTGRDTGFSECNNECDANEECKNSACWIPTSTLESSCASGCTFGVAIDGVYTYAGTAKPMTKTGALVVSIKPDPVAGFDVSIVQGS